MSLEETTIAYHYTTSASNTHTQFYYLPPGSKNMDCS
jgi:hypothetical protein